MSKRCITIGLTCIAGVLLLGTTLIVLAAAAEKPAAIPHTDWRQVNASGFGSQNNYTVNSLEVFGGQLYAGTSNTANEGEIWRTTDTVTWTQIISPGFGSAYASVLDLIEFAGRLYVGVGDGPPGQIWRSFNGVDWTQVEGGGFGNANNTAINNFGIFNNMLYAATINTVDGVEIWRSRTADNGDWSRVLANGNGNIDNVIINGFIEFDGYFYAAIENWGEGGDEIWRANDGLTWTPVVTDGFGDTDNDNLGLSGFAVLDGYLYIGTSNNTTGAQVYRSNNGTTWIQVVGDGFGDVNNFKIESMVHFAGLLCAGTNNEVTGIEVWCSSDGITWEQVNTDGFGDSNNACTLWSIGTVVHDNRLYIGTGNKAEGGEIWMMMLHQVFLPLVLSNH
jgi:hypothetical protein